jgi:hypothetical protein
VPKILYIELKKKNNYLVKHILMLILKKSFLIMLFASTIVYLVGLSFVYASSNLSSDVTNNESVTDIFSFWFAKSFWPSITQFIITGFASGGAIFGANVLLDRHRRPILSVDREDFTRVVQIDLLLYTIDIPDFSRELRQLTTAYTVNRVVVRNNTNYAAENCKGVIRIKDVEEKVCWYVDQERYAMTINSHSEEYLDTCAVLNETPEQVYQRIEEVITQRFGIGGRPGAEAAAFVREIYGGPEDIPIIISPTENGWKDAHLNRRIPAGNATLLITSKNGRGTVRQNIRILPRPNNQGRILEWR